MYLAEYPDPHMAGFLSNLAKGIKQAVMAPVKAIQQTVSNPLAIGKNVKALVMAPVKSGQALYQPLRPIAQKAAPLLPAFGPIGTAAAAAVKIDQAIIQKEKAAAELARNAAEVAKMEAQTAAINKQIADAKADYERRAAESAAAYQAAMDRRNAAITKPKAPVPGPVRQVAPPTAVTQTAPSANAVTAALPTPTNTMAPPTAQPQNFAITLTSPQGESSATPQAPATTAISVPNDKALLYGLGALGLILLLRK